MIRWIPTRAVLAALGFACLFAGCSTVPYTERNRIILMSESRERELGEQAFAEILAKNRCLQGPETELVRRVGRRIAAVAAPDCPGYDWEFVVIDAPKTVNAFCLPGGKVAFYSGILPICKDETGIAVVMGHEVAHALARHGAERMSQAMVLNAAASAVGSALGGKSEEGKDTATVIASAAFGIFFALPFSRKHESEADYIGLMLMAQAGYDPRGAIRFWDRMDAMSGGGSGIAFFATHPPNDKRKDDIDTAMSDALDYYEKATGQKIHHSVTISAGGG